jgi:glycosyltransferase involved in cell wall biosynthesis
VDRLAGEEISINAAKVNCRIVHVLFVGKVRFAGRLDEKTHQKVLLLSEALASQRIIGFAQSGVGGFVPGDADLFLLPNLPTRMARFLAGLVMIPPIVIWLILRRRVNVVVLSSPFEISASAAVGVCRLLGKCVGLVVESHSDFENSLQIQVPWMSGRLAKALATACARFSIRRATVLRGVSMSTVSQLSQFAPYLPTTCFPAWTDLDTFLAAGQHTKNARSDEILYAGRLSPIKGLCELIQAFSKVAAEIPSAKLSLIGPQVDKEFLEEALRLIAELGVSERVTIVPEMSQAELASRMVDATAVALFSRSEAFGRVVIEAMACGTPVIAASVGGIPELIEHGVSGLLVEPGDIDGFSEGLRRLVLEPEVAKEMGLRGRASVARYFSSERYRDSYHETFQLAVGSPGRHGVTGESGPQENARRP